MTTIIGEEITDHRIAQAQQSAPELDVSDPPEHGLVVRHHDAEADPVQGQGGDRHRHREQP